VLVGGGNWLYGTPGIGVLVGKGVNVQAEVKAAKGSQPKGTAEVTFDASKTSPGVIAKAITEKAGFKAEVSGTKK
jgi:copper chaperone CopZ